MTETIYLQNLKYLLSSGFFQKISVTPAFTNHVYYKETKGGGGGGWLMPFRVSQIFTTYEALLLHLS